MRTLHPRIPLLTLTALCAGLAWAPQARAQWSSDPLQNLSVADSATDQNQVKQVPTPDGGVWLSWLDGIGSGWDVRVQKLDAGGNEVFAHNGLLVADRSFSSTQDYGLAIDVNGDALVVFRDDRLGGIEITAAKVTQAGAQPWGPAGVTVTSAAVFVASPKITGTSDGGAVLGWMQDGLGKLQKLDSAGVPQWASPVTMTPPAGQYTVSDLHAAGTDAIVSIVHQTGGFTSPKHLLAQKFDSTGAPLWGASPVPVFDGGSLQFGNYPYFVPDQTGGGVFAWYSASPALQCWAQRLDSTGAELWAHNGVAVGNTAGQLRVEPHVAFDVANGDTYVAWRELNGTQSQWGIRAQRVDAAGTLQWGPGGAVLVGLGPIETGMPRVAPGGTSGGALVVWEEIPSFGADHLLAAHVNAAGAIDVPTFDVASTPSGKARLDCAVSAGGQVLLAWSDARVDDGDIYAQNVAFDGTLGGGSGLGTSYCGAVANSTGGAGMMNAVGSPVAADNLVTLQATGLPNNQFGFFLTSMTQAFIANPGGSQGNLCILGSIGRYNLVNQIFFTGTTGSGQLTLDLTQTPTASGPVPVLAGQTWNFQAWYRDQNPSNASNFTDGYAILFQ